MIMRKKTTHALPIEILERLRIHAAITQKDQQDIIADLLDANLPPHPFKKLDTDQEVA
jgi:hypothetical protein